MVYIDESEELLPGQNVFVKRVRKYFEVDSRRPFYYIDSRVLTASQDLDSQELTELKTSNIQVLHVTGIALQNDIYLYLKYNSKDVFGTKSEGYITQKVAPMFNAFNPNSWFHDLSPFARLVEQLGVGVTAKTHYTGMIYDLTQLTEKPEKFKTVDG